MKDLLKSEVGPDRDRHVSGLRRLYSSIVVVWLLAGLLPAAHGEPAFRARSMWSMRWPGIVRQDTDAGCGAAALATVLRLYFNHSVTEQGIYRAAGIEEPPVGGLSLGDIDRAAENLGYEGIGLRMTDAGLFRFLAEQQLPLIVHVVLRQPHFTAVLARVGQRLVLADPTQGLITLTMAEFRRNWSHVGYILVPPDGRALAGRNIDDIRQKTQRRLAFLASTVHRRSRP